MSDKQKELNDLKQLIAAYSEDIPLFARQVLKFELTPKQREFCEAFQNNQQIAFRGGTSLGKSFTVAVLMWHSLICFDEVKISVFGPSEPNLKSGIWNELQRFHDRMIPVFRDAFTVQEKKIFRNVNSASCTAEMRLADKSNTARARGLHSRFNYVFVDEASGVDDEVFTDALVNILSDGPGAKLVLISNPDRASGFFWRCFNDPELSPAWTKVHGSYFDSKNYDPATFENFARNYGSPTTKQYRSMILGDFPLADTEGLFSRELIDFALQNDDVVPSPTSAVVWGLDVAGQGSDASILCIRHDNKIIGFKEYQNLNAVQLAERISDLFQKTPKNQQPAVIAVDSTGFGSGYADVLREFKMPVYSCNFAGTPTRGPDKYSRVRDQIWCELKDWIHSEAAHIPNHAKFLEDMLCIQYEDTSGKIKLEDKKAIRKRLGRSPDYGDAAALTFAVSPTRYTSKYSWSKPIVYNNLQTFE